MRCLIVEDDFAAQQLLTILLSDYAECSVAFDGKTGVERFVMALDEGTPYDLICLDVMLPQQGGHETLQRIRRIEQERGIRPADGVKVIMTTMLEDRRTMDRAFKAGCYPY